MAHAYGGLNIDAMYKLPPSSFKFEPLFDFTSSVTINSPFDEEVNNDISGDLLASDSVAAIYLDTRDGGLVTSGDAVQMLNTFSTITRPRVRAFFGSESDIDANGGVIIFLSSKMPQGVLGFFRPIDLLPDGVDPDTESNETEILYAALPPGGAISPLFNATLAHEFCHLVNFSTKSLPVFNASGGTNILVEELATEEGKCHLTEDIVGFGGGDTFAVAGEFLENIELASTMGSVDSSLQSGRN